MSLDLQFEADYGANCVRNCRMKRIIDNWEIVEATSRARSPITIRRLPRVIQNSRANRRRLISKSYLRGGRKMVRNRIKQTFIPSDSEIITPSSSENEAIPRSTRRGRGIIPSLRERNNRLRYMTKPPPDGHPIYEKKVYERHHVEVEFVNRMGTENAASTQNLNPVLRIPLKVDIMHPIEDGFGTADFPDRVICEAIYDTCDCVVTRVLEMYSSDHMNSKRLGKCPVCLLPLIDDIMATKCGHLFCKECIIKVVENTSACAKCRQPNEMEDLRQLYL